MEEVEGCMYLIPSFVGQFHTVIGNELVDGPVLVSLGLGMANEDDETWFSHCDFSSSLNHSFTDPCTCTVSSGGEIHMYGWKLRLILASSRSVDWLIEAGAKGRLQAKKRRHQVDLYFIDFPSILSRANRDILG